MIALVQLLNTMGRTFYTTLTGKLRDGNMTHHPIDFKPTSEKDAILVSSLCEDGMHAPVLDIDFSAYLVPSTTKDHFHLYLNKKMTWEQYAQLLKALHEAGIIQKGFYEGSLSRRQSMVLMPGKNRVDLTDGPRAIT